MSNFFQSVRQNFGRQSNRANGTGNNSSQRGNSSSGPSPSSSSHALHQTTSFSSNMSSDEMQQAGDSQLDPEPTKFFFQETYARLGVKGNFLPLAAQPPNVDLGEWLAHHCVMQSSAVDQFILAIFEVDNNTGLPICNPRSCPVMSAGRSHTYTWLNSKKEPVKVPAAQYIQLVQKWINGKVGDSRVFPTDPPTNSPAAFPLSGPNTSGATSPSAGTPTVTTPPPTFTSNDWVGKAAGFPETFFGDCKTIFRQLFRVFAHLYHSHWVDPFWHMSDVGNGHGYLDLNSLFAYFITIAKLFGLLSDKDLEPMQPLIDIWIANGSIPAEAAAGACTIVPAQ